MKIVNTSDKDYYFTFDGGNYPVMKPGVVMDFPDEVAHHAIRRSVVNDENGDLTGYRVHPFDNVKGDSGIMERIAIPCPYRDLEDCASEPFRSKEELRRHLDQVHFAEHETIAVPKAKEDKPGKALGLR